MQEMAGDLGSIPRSGRSPGGEHDNPLQYCQENPVDRELDGLQSMGSHRVRVYMHKHSNSEKEMIENKIDYYSGHLSFRTALFSFNMGSSFEGEVNKCQKKSHKPNLYFLLDALKRAKEIIQREYGSMNNVNNAPRPLLKDVHVLIPETYEDVTLYDKRKFRDVIKLGYLRWRVYSRLFAQVQCNHKCPYKREARRSKSKKGSMKMEQPELM